MFVWNILTRLHWIVKNVSDVGKWCFHRVKWNPDNHCGGISMMAVWALAKPVGWVEFLTIVVFRTEDQQTNCLTIISTLTHKLILETDPRSVSLQIRHRVMNPLVKLCLLAKNSVDCFVTSCVCWLTCTSLVCPHLVWFLFIVSTCSSLLCVYMFPSKLRPGRFSDVRSCMCTSILFCLTLSTIFVTFPPWSHFCVLFPLSNVFLLQTDLCCFAFFLIRKISTCVETFVIKTI